MSHDVLKELILRVHELVEVLGEELLFEHNIPEDATAISLTEAIKLELVEAAGRAGVATDLHTYVDGSPVVERVELRPGYRVDYFPRLDGPRERHLRKFYPKLKGELL